MWAARRAMPGADSNFRKTPPRNPCVTTITRNERRRGDSFPRCPNRRSHCTIWIAGRAAWKAGLETLCRIRMARGKKVDCGACCCKQRLSKKESNTVKTRRKNRDRIGTRVFRVTLKSKNRDRGVDCDGTILAKKGWINLCKRQLKCRGNSETHSEYRRNYRGKQ